MGIETTWMKDGKSEDGVKGKSTNPQSMKSYADSQHDRLSMVSGKNILIDNLNCLNM